MRSDEIPLCETVEPQTSTIVGANRHRRGAGNRGSIVADARQSEPPESLAENIDGECAIGRQPPLSGSDSSDPNAQNPAESRDFLDLGSHAWEKSLPSQTQSRWGESGANSSLGAIP
jgi:hypothetical protein